MNRGPAILLAAVLLAPGLAGCLGPSEDGPGPGLEVNRTPPEMPDVPDSPPGDLVRAPDLSELDELRPKLPERGCQSSSKAEEAADTWEPEAEAPHEVSLEGELACLGVSGVEARAEGDELRIEPVEGDFAGTPRLAWPNASFDPEGPEGPANLEEVEVPEEGSLELTGLVSIETTSLHRLQEDSFSVAVLGEIPDVPEQVREAFQRASIEASHGLNGSGTVLVDGEARQGSLELPAGEGHLVSSGRLTVPEPAYRAQGNESGQLQLRGTEELAFASGRTNGSVDLSVVEANVSHEAGTTRLDAALEQAWKGSRPLLEAELDAEVHTPGLLAIHEASSKASLAGIQVEVLEAPEGTDVGIGQTRDTPDRDAADTAIEVTRGLMAALTFGLSEAAWDIPPVPPGQTLYAPVTADGDNPNGTARLEVTSANGGAWSGEVPLG